MEKLIVILKNLLNVKKKKKGILHFEEPFNLNVIVD